MDLLINELTRLSDYVIVLKNSLHEVEKDLKKAFMIIHGLKDDAPSHVCDYTHECEHVWQKILETHETWRCKVCGNEK